MAHPLLWLMKAYYAFTKTKVRPRRDDSLSFEVCSSVRKECAFSSTLFNNIIILGSWSGIVRFHRGLGWNKCPCDQLRLWRRHTYVPLGSNYRHMQDLTEAANHYNADMQTDASKTKVLPALSPGKQRHVVPIAGESLEDLD